MTRWSATAAFVAVVCLLSACKKGDAPQDLPTATPSAAAPTIVPPLVETPLGREALLLAIARAASDTALGRDQSATQRDLDGSRFALRMRFGCAGDEPVPGRRLTFDETRGKLELRLDNEIGAQTPLVLGLRESGYEAVEGFWVHRPWLLDADCRQAAPGAEAPRTIAAPSPGPEPSGQPPSLNLDAGETSSSERESIGIAQFFTPDDARTHRRAERGYAVTKLLSAGESRSSEGYDIVLAGRLRRLASGRVIACTVRRTSAPPDCLVSVQFDNVAIVNPSTGEVLAQWSGA
ncbi:hypothetical protein WG901_23000 [Novosphingobium sp. PS1R-30]|uniref:Lipoprotein n=1 Tax=Novosphingobium anseongense TaxID=3133436 RepID=A0ABU8S2N2_9SPHN